ncbi:hypothetical protein AERO9AM_20342 [Aeromicrobium sp. 9AM]|nr:hypothetical protein AERO9AM_20342 [Aeromicrobium sp. 9AM]
MLAPAHAAVDLRRDRHRRARAGDRRGHRRSPSQGRSHRDREAALTGKTTGSHLDRYITVHRAFTLGRTSIHLRLIASRDVSI